MTTNNYSTTWSRRTRVASLSQPHFSLRLRGTYNRLLSISEKALLLIQWLLYKRRPALAKAFPSSTFSSPIHPRREGALVSSPWQQTTLILVHFHLSTNPSVDYFSSALLFFAVQTCRIRRYLSTSEWISQVSLGQLGTLVFANH